EKRSFRRVFVGESHLTFTSSSWRAKLTTVRLVRGLRAPKIMLKATLPIVLEFEPEANMEAQMARYIRMATTRTRTRYIVDHCPAGTGFDRTVEIWRRMQEDLGWQKGVDRSAGDGRVHHDRGCRRQVMSGYLDGQETACQAHGGMAHCDRCGGGITELERRYMATSKERQAVEETLDELLDGCACKRSTA
ncbi:hypothetical protein LTR87_016936, partial [Friedmanniomyces endolithicus]